MVNLYDILAYLYPSANISSFGNVQLADDGNGPYIAKWDTTLGPKPSQAQLDAALLPVSKIVQKRIIADSRFEAETSGIIFNGMLIRTDRESQATLTNAYIRVQQQPFALIDWKTESGWSQVDKATIEAWCIAVGAHVHVQFSKEKALCEQIDSCTTVLDVEGIVW